MRNLKLTLAYDGSGFSGWQIQPGRPTIQGTLAEAVTRLTGESTLPQGSGRTDAGVHALAQVVTLNTASRIPEDNFKIALNDILPASIRILNVDTEAMDFHARKSARAKTYVYRIHRGDVCPPFLARFVCHHPYPLDEEAMIRSAPLVEGEHDFTSFAAVDPEERLQGEENQNLPTGYQRSNVRTIFQSRWERRALLPWTGASGDPAAESARLASPIPEAGYELVYTVRGSGFLHHMVRNLVGMFLLLGKGTLGSADIPRILRAASRATNPAATAPASGLYMASVEY